MFIRVGNQSWLRAEIIGRRESGFCVVKTKFGIRILHRNEIKASRRSRKFHYR